MSTEDDQRANANALAHLESLGIHKPQGAKGPSPVAPSIDTSAPREPRTHDLKVQTQFWADLWEFRTTAQLRQDDRQYRVGDVLLLREYNPQFGYTGMNCKRKITHILRHEDVPYGVRRGWCILSTAVMPEPERCTSTMSEDGGSCSDRVPCTGVRNADGTMEGGCGEPCSFVMDRAGDTRFAETIFKAAYDAAATRASLFHPTKITDWATHRDDAWASYRDSVGTT